MDFLLWEQKTIELNLFCDAFNIKLFQCRYLWRGKHTFAIAQHKHHRSIYEEADANKRRKRYARPLIDLHMKIYYYEGMKPWSSKKDTISGKMGNETLWFCDLFAQFDYNINFGIHLRW